MSEVVIRFTSDEAKVYKAMQRLVDQQAKLNAKLAEAGQVGQSASDRVSRSFGQQQAAMDNATKSLNQYSAAFTGIGAAAASVGAAITQALRDQSQLLKENADRVKGLGAAQEASGLNFTGLTDTQKVQAQGISKRVAQQTGFSDVALLERTAGEAYSAKADLQAVESAVLKSAELNMLNPANVKPMAVGALDAAQATGTIDAEKNLSYLLSAQKAARIVTPEGVSKNLPVVASNIQGGVPSQSKEESAKQVAAMFGVASQALVDSTGDMTKSALVEHGRALNEFFTTAPEEAKKASIRLNELTAEQAKKGTLSERDQAEMSDLQAKKSALEGVKDSGTYFGRIQALQNNPAAAKLFSEKSFGPGEAKGIYQAILDPNSDFSKNVQSALGEIDLSSATYQNAVRQQDLTPEQRLAKLAAKAEGDRALYQSDPNKAGKAVISDIVTKTLGDTRSGNIFGALQAGVDVPMFGRISTEAANAANIENAGDIPQAVSIARQSLLKRKGDLEGYRFSGGPLTRDEGNKMAQIDSAIMRLKQIEEALTKAATSMTGAGDKMNAAASKMTSPSSMTKLARAQAEQ